MHSPLTRLGWKSHIARMDEGGVAKKILFDDIWDSTDADGGRDIVGKISGIILGFLNWMAVSLNMDTWRSLIQEAFFIQK